ncbi:MAG TPA: DUF5818 domain-containing protein [Terriglobales bacterium]
MKIMAHHLFAGAAIMLLVCSMPGIAQQASTPGPQPGQTQADQEASPAPAQLRAFTGEIVETAAGLILQDKATNSSYKLDDQKQARRFAGKNVKVNGTLDAATNTIKVADIEVLTTN